MFDILPNDDFWEQEPSWERIFYAWKKFLFAFADEHGFSIIDNRLVLTTDDTADTLKLVHAQIHMAQTIDKLSELLPTWAYHINRLPY